MKKITLLAAVLWAALSFAYGQHYLNGIIINAESGKALQGAAIVNLDDKSGAYSDQHGEFSLCVKDFPVSLKISHIGYAVKTLECGEGYCRIALEPAVLHADEVFVTAQRAIDCKTPVAMSVLKREDIDLLYYRQDVPLVLEMEPGVYAYSDAGDGTGYSYLNIRGFTQDRIGVLYNGVPLNDPEAHAVYWVDHGDVLADASDIQVQRGTGNSLASGAFGGTINVESDISALHPGVRANFAYSNYIDGYGLNAPGSKRSVSYVGNPFPEEGISVAFRFSDMNSSGYRIDSGNEQQAAHVALQWVQPTHMTRAEYLWGDQATNFSWDGISPQYGFDLNDPEDRRYNFYADTSYHSGFSDVNRDVFTQSVYLVNHTRLLNEKLKMYATLYHIGGSGYYQQFKADSDPADYKLIGRIPNDSTDIDIMRRKWLDNRYSGAVWHLRYLLPKHMLTLGGDLRFYGSEHYGKLVYIEDFGAADYTYYLNHTRKNSASIYIQDMLTLGEKLFLQADLRYLTHRFTLDQDSLGIVDNPFHFILPYNFLDMHAGLRYQINDDFSAFVNFSTSTREPSSNDIYDDGDPSVIAAVADPYSGTVTEPLIDHESLRDLELGVDYESKFLKIALNLYRMDFRNELIPVYYRYRDTDQVLRGNAPKTLHQGIELALSARPGKFSLHGNLSLADNRFVEFIADSLGWGGFGGIADYSGKQIPAFPALQAKFRLAWHHERFIPWLNLRYSGKQYIDFMNTESAAIDPYWVADIGLNIPLEFMKMEHVINLRVNNLFNTFYENFGYVYYNSPDERIDNYWPAATRSFYLSWTLLFGL